MRQSMPLPEPEPLQEPDLVLEPVPEVRQSVPVVPPPATLNFNTIQLNHTAALFKGLSAARYSE